MSKYCDMLKTVLIPSKIIRDLAKMLDHTLFVLDGKLGYDESRMAESREEVFHDFCALCVRENIPVPELEREIVNALAPKVDKKVAETYTATATTTVTEPVLKRLSAKRSRKAQECRLLAKSFALLPSLSSSFSGLKGKELTSLLNQMLMEMGIEPLRPDYEARTVKQTRFTAPTEKTVKVLIVDDEVLEILKTMRSLAGWENVEVTALLYKCSGNRWNLKPEEKMDELQRMAQEVLSQNSDVVLMDQGMNVIEGSDLISKIKELAVNAPIFVGNTGGNGDELREAGAIGNCRKGEDLSAVANMIRRF